MSEWNAVKCSACSIAHVPESADMSQSWMDLKHSSVSIAFHSSLDVLFNCDGRWRLSLNVWECQCVCLCPEGTQSRSQQNTWRNEQDCSQKSNIALQHSMTHSQYHSIQRHTHCSALLITLSIHRVIHLIRREKSTCMYVYIYIYVLLSYITSKNMPSFFLNKRIFLHPQSKH